MRSRVLSANVLSESSESEHGQKALHSGIFKALELVESYPDLCNNKNMPKSTVSSVWGKSINKAALFIFNDTICLSFQPKRKIFQSESMEKFLRAEKGRYGVGCGPWKIEDSEWQKHLEVLHGCSFVFASSATMEANTCSS